MSASKNILRAAWIGCFAAAFGIAASLGCGSVGDVARPKDPTAAGVLGEATCKQVGKEGRPLIVDWIPESRQDLEVVMKNSVAVVAYDCNSIKVLPDCKV